jgi:hypothetical protein
VEILTGSNPALGTQYLGKGRYMHQFKVLATWKSEPDITVTVRNSGPSPVEPAKTRWLCDISDGTHTYDGYWIDAPHDDPRKIVVTLATFMGSFSDLGGTNEDGEPIPDALYRLASDHVDSWSMASADDDPDADCEHFIELVA